jgi:hypothetical protein
VNLTGLAAAGAAFVGVWFGHVAVRKIEFISPAIWLPTVIFGLAGLAFEWASMSTTNSHLSTVCGILGITLLWDALEFARQQRRVIQGHAPANPNNPRHVKILARHNSATTINLLKREPLGRPASLSQN